MTTSKAAKAIGIEDRKGSITINKDADIVIMDEQNDVMLTICRGEIAFQQNV